MYWVITAFVSVPLLIAFFLHLSKRWRLLVGESPESRLNLMVVNSIRQLEPAFPGTENYSDLKFSLIRHAFVFALSSAILFSTRNIFAVVVIGVSNMAYAHLTYSRYKYRNALLKDMAPYEEEIHKYSSAMVEDSRSCVTYAFICVIALYLLVFFR